LYGSGRTDAGVHALAQVAHLDVSTSLPADSLLRRLNDELPSDIHVLAATVVSHRFHARHDAVARRYLYQISRRRTAFAKPYVWWVKEPLTVARMNDAAAMLVGLRDFRSFAQWENEDEDDGRRRSSVVLLDRVEVADSGDLVLIAVEGSHFLWKMVRRIVGVLVEIGRGELESSAISELLAKPSEIAARRTAPASGLFLERVYYKGDPRDVALTAATPLFGGARAVSICT
jgi:tRNA pseudouridine38-40 synthase